MHTKTQSKLHEHNPSKQVCTGTMGPKQASCTGPIKICSNSWPLSHLIFGCLLITCVGEMGLFIQEALKMLGTYK